MAILNGGQWLWVPGYIRQVTPRHASCGRGTHPAKLEKGCSKLGYGNRPKSPGGTWKQAGPS